MKEDAVCKLKVRNCLTAVSPSMHSYVLLFLTGFQACMKFYESLARCALCRKLVVWGECVLFGAL